MVVQVYCDYGVLFFVGYVEQYLVVGDVGIVYYDVQFVQFDGVGEQFVGCCVLVDIIGYCDGFSISIGSGGVDFVDDVGSIQGGSNIVDDDGGV